MSVEVVPFELLKLVADTYQPPMPTPRPSTNGHTQQRQRTGSAVDVLERARKYLEKIPPAIDGQGGSKDCFRAACVLVKGFDLGQEEAFAAIQDWNSTCQPPWSEKELRHKIADADRAADTQPRGYLLNDNRPATSTNGRHAEKAKPVAETSATVPATPVQEEDDTILLPESEPWPQEPDKAAYHGLAGEIVYAITPETEADPIAVLTQFLVMFGNYIGRNAHWKVEEDQHFCNLFACLVGDTAIGRKGTSKGRALAPFAAIDEDWRKHCINSGLSSGEGLIEAVRDSQQNDLGETVKQAAADKRLLVIESEFCGALKVMRRDGNILSMVIRQAWDSGTLRTLTKTNKSSATDAHVSILGHVTRKELLQTLADVEGHNGFANRFLWIAVRRSKLLPMGGKPVNFSLYAEDLAKAAEFAKTCWQVGFTKDAVDLWDAGGLYRRLNGPQGSTVPEIISRGAAQVRRLALIYAMLDRAQVVSTKHLQAALALWDYSVRSVRWVFGSSTGDKLADDLYLALKAAGEQGMTCTDIRNYLGKNEKKATVGRSLSTLKEQGLAYARTQKSGTGAGRPAERWYAGSDPGDQGV